jgi:riboflavin kinase
LTKIITFQGKIVSGQKHGQKFVNLPWVKKQIKEKLGFNPYIGTLNLKLAKEIERKELDKYKGIIIKPERGYYEGKCYRALLMKKIEVAAVIPNSPDYPPDLLELIAPVNLRNTFGFEDGRIINISIFVE